MNKWLQLLMRRLEDETNGGEGGGGGGGGGGGPKPAPQPETFSREYVTELRGENASYRTKAKEAEERAKTAEEAAKKAQEEADAKTKEADSKANERIIRAELKAAAIKAGMVDLDGLKLADLSTVKLNDAGEVEGADALMEAMKKAKPYLFKDATSTSHPGKPPEKSDAKDKSAKDMTDEEWKAHKRKLGIRR